MADLMVPYRCDGCENEHIDHYRMALPSDVPLVVEWLREQGAIDYGTASNVLRRYVRKTTLGFGKLTEEVIDAALRPPVSSSRENP